MREMELLKPVQMEPNQSRLLDLHSALNVLTVIANEINILSLLAGKPPELNHSHQAIQKLKFVFLDDSVAFNHCESQLQTSQQEIMSEVQTLLALHPELSSEIDLPLFQRNLESLFHILGIRYRELLQRQGDPFKWGNLETDTLRTDLIHVFEAMELNSHGRYHIVYHSNEKKPEDYLIEIDILSRQEPLIHMPLVLQDIMRDLTANARKYSEPGGRVLTRLEDDGQKLILTVTDQGMGIPEAELEQIVEFGQRASNAKQKRTMGGGFGLTKAWYFTYHLGGRMWLASGLGEGTRIRIEIPQVGPNPQETKEIPDASSDSDC